VVAFFMKKQIVTFTLDSDKVNALNDLAAAVGCDRAFLLNEAVTVYLDVQQWQRKHIEAAIKQADSGQFVEHLKIKKAAASWRHRL
jgi:predicted transcriptional regulator